MSTVSQPDPVGGIMHVDTAEFAALRDEVTELAAQLKALSRGLEYAFETGRAYERGETRQTQRPRHLRAVDSAS